MSDTLDQSRLDRLEIQAAHHERTIEDMNAALVAQWTEIDRLRRQLAQMAERVAEAEHRLGPAAANQKPPHY